MGDPLPAAPVFAAIGALTGKIGIEDRFFEIRDIIVKSDGYTVAIGEDLMIEASVIGRSFLFWELFLGRRYVCPLT